MRDLSTALTEAFAADVIRPITMLKLQLDDNDILVHSGLGTIIYGGDSYVGVGNYGTISEFGELFDNSPAGLTASLSGIPTEYLTVMISEHYQGRSAEVFMALLDESHTLIADPALVFRGRIDYADIQLGETADISLTIESRLVDWSRARVRRYTNADQQLRYPDDLGFEFVSQMVEKELVWGSY